MAARTGMATLITRLRGLVNDNWRLHHDTATGDGGAVLYWLNNKPNKSGGTVSVGGTVQAGTLYSWELTYGRVEFTSAPANNAAIVIEYQASDFTDDQLQTVLDSHVTFLRDEELLWLPETIGGGSIEYHDAKTAWRDFEETTSGTVQWVIRDGPGAVQGTAGYTPNYLNGIIRFGADQGGTTYYLTARSYDLYSAAADIWQQRQATFADWYEFKADGQQFSRQQAYEHAVRMESQMRRRAGQNRQSGELQVSTFVRTDVNRSEA